jgi:hypothetical protein
VWVGPASASRVEWDTVRPRSAIISMALVIGPSHKKLELSRKSMHIFLFSDLWSKSLSDFKDRIVLDRTSIADCDTGMIKVITAAFKAARAFIFL